MKNPIGFARRHLHDLDRWIRRKATARAIETINLGGVTASYSCVEDKELARVRSLGGEHLMQVLLETQLRAGDVVYDIGANIGFYSVLFAKKVGTNGKVFAFEPETLNFERLRANADLNRLGNLIPCPFALGAETQMLFLKRHSNEAGEGAHGIVETAGENTIPIFCFPLDFLINEFCLPPPTVVKIDIEGYEAEALSGMKETLANKSIRVAFIEIHYWRGTSNGRHAFSDSEQKEFRQQIIDSMAAGNLNLVEEISLEEAGHRYAHAVFRQVGDLQD